jgi:hypothetical protein
MRRGRVAFVAAALVFLIAVPSAATAPPTLKLPQTSPIAQLPATVNGTTAGARLGAREPHPWCTSAVGVVWYELHPSRRSAIVLRLHAHGKLDAAVAVYHDVRSRLLHAACARTNTFGRAAVAFYGSLRGKYLVGIARQVGSVDASFTLSALAAERPARPPGDALPAGGIRSTLNAVLDPSDAWSVELSRGTTYRFNVTSRVCMGMQLYRPHIYSFTTSRPVLATDCGGYQTFTPGPDGGGLYTLRVSTSGAGTATQPYLLTFAQAEADDIGPGLPLANGATVSGRISGRGIDNVDLYRIAVPRDHEQTTIDFREKPTTQMDLMLLAEDGRHISCVCESQGRQRLRQVLPAGHYFVVVRSRHRSGGPYSLGVITRDITTTALTATGGASTLDVTPGATVTFTAHVDQAHDGGPLTVEIQRFDPLAHWQFSTLYRQQIGADGSFMTSWTPPSVGRWRAHARFFGTRFSSFSESGWVTVRVAEPLG